MRKIYTQNLASQFGVVEAPLFLQKLYANMPRYAILLYTRFFTLLSLFCLRRLVAVLRCTSRQTLRTEIALRRSPSAATASSSEQLDLHKTAACQSWSAMQ